MRHFSPGKRIRPQKLHPNDAVALIWRLVVPVRVSFLRHADVVALVARRPGGW